MSAGRRKQKKRKSDQEDDCLDVSDDFQNDATHFRFPKKLLASKSRGNPKSKRKKLDRNTHSVPISYKTRRASQSSEGNLSAVPPKPNPMKPDKEPSLENSDLEEIEKSLCSESEKLCLSCKLIVPCDVFGEHLKECMQRFRLTKEGPGKQIPVSERETNEQEKQQAVLPCPVCKKAFKSRTQRTIHMKSCAQDNGLTPEQLLQASRLLEKQSEEWNELGLPAAHMSCATEQRIRSPKLNSRDLKDPDVAMAVALSRSLAEEKVLSRVSREEKLLAMGLENIVVEDRRVSPLLSLPLPDSASHVAPRNRLKRGGKNQKGRPQLHTLALAKRSMEERERLISEKVAVMLTCEDTSRSGWQHGETGEKPGKLQSLINKECRLWEMAGGSADNSLHSFYVPDLERFITPKETVVGHLLRSLSQIPGRLNATTLHNLDEESESDSELESTALGEELSTQMALAGLLGSQEDMNITTELDWEQMREGTPSQGFIMPTTADIKLCTLSKDNDPVEAMDINPDDPVEISDAEKVSVTSKLISNETNEDNVSQSRGSLESVSSGQTHAPESSIHSEKENLAIESENSHPLVYNYDQKRIEKNKHSNISLKLSENYHEATFSKVFCNFIHSLSNGEHEGHEEQLENSLSLPLKNCKAGTCISPTEPNYENEMENLGPPPNNKVPTFLPAGKDDVISSPKADVIPKPEAVTCALKEEMLSNNLVNSFKNDGMIQTLIQNWSDLLESGTESDVNITTSEGHVTQAHSLVLLARCPKLYKEMKAHGKIIKWNETPGEVVHLFLSYLYTGTCKINSSDALWRKLYNTAVKYECEDLVSSMELSHTVINNSVNTLDSRLEKVKKPLLLVKELDSSKRKSNKAQILCREEQSKDKNILANSVNNLSLTTDINIEEALNIEEVKCINHIDRENFNASKYSSYSLLRSNDKEQDRVESLERKYGRESPDMFEEPFNGETDCIISPIPHSPAYVSTPHHFPCIEITQLEPRHPEEELSVVYSKTSSPCKSFGDEDCEDKETVLSVTHTATHPTKSKGVLESNTTGTSDVISLVTESKLKSPLKSTLNLVALSKHTDNIEENDIVDLTQSSFKYPLEEGALDCPGPEVEGNNNPVVVDFIKDENEDLMKTESEPEERHYISNIWDDFNAESSLVVTDEIPFYSDKLEGNSEKRSRVDEGDLHLSTHGQSASIIITPKQLFRDIEKCKDDDGLDTCTQNENSLRCKAKQSVSPQALGESTFVRYFEENSGDDTLVHAAAEFEKSEAMCLKVNEKEASRSRVIPAYNSLAATPKQNSTHEVNTTITPKPEFCKMKSPELKKQLQKYGICSLGRKKAVAVLQHIYEQTHPLVTDSEAESSYSQTPQRISVMPVCGPSLNNVLLRKDRRYGSTQELQQLNNKNLLERETENHFNTNKDWRASDVEEANNDLNSSFTSTSSSEVSHEGIARDAVSADDDEYISSTEQVGLISQIQEFITGNADLYRKVLMYEPVFAENLHAMLKANKIKCSMHSLLDVLDELCVIVRTEAHKKNRERKKKVVREKKTKRKTGGETT